MTTASRTLGKIAVESPGAMPVLARRDLDFCTHGELVLEDMCRARGLDLAELVAELEAAAEPAPWAGGPSSQLVDCIVEHYHTPASELLSVLERVSDHAIQEHGEAHPQLAEVREVLGGLHRDFILQILLEEEEVFPLLRTGAPDLPAEVQLQADRGRDQVRRQVLALRELAPEDPLAGPGSVSWRALWAGIHHLDALLEAHDRLEDELLDPPAEQDVATAPAPARRPPSSGSRRTMQLDIRNLQRSPRPALTAGVGWVVVGLLDVPWAAPQVAVALLGVASAAGAALLAWRDEYHAHAILLGSTLVCLTLEGVFGGSWALPAAWGIAAVPTLALLLRGGGGWSWAVAAAVCVVLLAALGITPPEHLIAQLALGLLSRQVADGFARDLEGQLQALRSAAKDAEQGRHVLLAQRFELESRRATAEADALARSRFAAAVSHEIKTPVHAMLGLAQLLLDEPDLAQRRVFLAELVRSGRALLRMVNDVLDFSRADQGSLPVERSAFDLDLAVEEALDLYASDALGQGIELAYIPDPTLLTRVVGSPGRLRQVVANLVGNALKFTERGEVVVAARVADECVHLSVRDTGPGIPRAKLQRIWEPWVRGEDRQEAGGTGLGLALVRALMESIGGSADVDSVEGRGTTVTARFPVGFASQPTRTEDELAARVLVVLEPGPTWKCIEAYCLRWRIAVERCDLAQVPSRLERFDPEVLLASSDCELPAVPDSITTVLVGVGTPENGKLLMRPIRRDSLRSALIQGITGTDALQLPFDSGVAARNPLRILIAEDNPTNQQVMALTLRRFGYEADIASNGREAVERAADTPYDLVLMDRLMPVLDGIAAASQILMQAPDTRIVMVSAGYDAGQRQECMAMGVTEFLDKPVEASDLRRVLEGHSGMLAPVVPSEGTRSVASGPLDDALEQLLVLTGGDVTALEDLVHTWVATTRTRLSQLEDALAREDASAVASIAHVTKGTAATFGASEVADLALQLQRQLADEAQVDDRTRRLGTHLVLVMADTATKIEAALTRAAAEERERDAT